MAIEILESQAHYLKILCDKMDGQTQAILQVKHAIEDLKAAIREPCIEVQKYPLEGLEEESVKKVAKKKKKGKAK